MYLTCLIVSRINYGYHRLLEAHALGNFQTFVEEITINPSMMLFLDTARNTKWSPNENYARELLELFTVILIMFKG